MIIDHLRHAETYAPLGPGLAAALRHAQSQAAALPEGKTELDGDALYVNVRDIPSGPMDACLFEAHRRYIDLHVILEGTEWLEYAQTEALELREERPARDDCNLYAGQGSAVRLEPGDFYIAFPQDAHKPNRHTDIPCVIRKAVYKIAVSE